MKYVKLFEQFINESGNAVADSVPIEQADVQPTVDWVVSNIFPKVGLEDLNDDAAVIGSAGKKAKGQTSGDIDIAVSADKIASYFGVALKDALDALNNQLQSMGYNTAVARGFNQVSFGAPIAGDKSKGIAQIDFMLSTDLEWSKFMYHSPNFQEAESRYKGAYRNLLLMAAMGESYRNIISTTSKGETKEYEAYVIRLNQGVFQVRKSFEGKKGLLKTAKLLHDYDALITKTPEEVVNLLFKGGHSVKEVSTYENLKQLIDSSDFKFPDVRPAIYTDFRKKLEDSKLPLPEDLP